MWVSRKEYITLIQTRAAADVDAAQYHIRMNEAKDQINRLRHELELERARANAAVDALLVEKGHMPVSVSETPDPSQLFEEDPDELQVQARAIAENGLAYVLSESQ